MATAEEHARRRLRTTLVPHAEEKEGNNAVYNQTLISGEHHDQVPTHDAAATSAHGASETHSVYTLLRQWAGTTPRVSDATVIRSPFPPGATFPRALNVHAYLTPPGISLLVSMGLIVPFTASSKLSCFSS